ncbi:taxane 10-beta-hydroxylase-like isoform X2 [Pistacia vera]|uniref:taxane 10-beta-hydroxylase-like isoform X2 n=1 Tax=Pistacia vera TaxID=55513 RepID=UPI001263DDF5|nr:taxane 10-beta-hydroxylase-like isoform X2 [Pistacia vera]XP_031277344.1 taxane 10-beta-hydroxylase-like isoform X2 [Pistacia vera]
MDSLIKQQLFLELNGMESVKVAPQLKKTAFKVTCSLLYALSEGKEKDALLENFAIALKGIRCVPLNFPGTLYRKSLIARARIRNLFTQLIARRRRELEEGKVSSHEDIISTLVSLRDEDGKPLLEEEIIDNLITLMMASHDTIAILLIHFVRLRARDAEICDKVLQEQKEVVKASEGSGGKLSRREVQMMKYTWSVAQEIMRLTPPVIGNFRRAWRDTRFDGFDIPKRMAV